MSHRGAPAVVVAAIGSALRRDDGVGPAVLGRARGLLDGLAAMDTLTAPLDLLDRWDGAALAVVVDALRGDEPGRVHVVELVAAPAVGSSAARALGASSHGLGVVEAFRLAQVLGSAPSRVVLVGVTGADFGAGPGLSPCVDAAVDVAAALVVGLVHRALARADLSIVSAWPAPSPPAGPPGPASTRARRPA